MCATGASAEVNCSGSGCGCRQALCAAAGKQQCGRASRALSLCASERVTSPSVHVCLHLGSVFHCVILYHNILHMTWSSLSQHILHYILNSTF